MKKFTTLFKETLFPDHHQFSKDVDWCQSQMLEQSAILAYWDNINDFSFSRGSKRKQAYWDKVHRKAREKFMRQLPPKDLDFEAAYRELNRASLFIINVMASSLADEQTGSHTDVTEKMIEVTHELWGGKAPRTLQQHDHTLTLLLDCLKEFEIDLNSPSTEFIDYDKRMNHQRFKQDSYHDGINSISDLGVSGFTKTNNDLHIFAGKAVAKAKETFHNKPIHCSLWACRHDGYEMLSCDLFSDDGALEMPMTILAENEQNLTFINEPCVHDMVEALHLASLIIGGLDPKIQIGRHSNETNESLLARPLKENETNGNINLWTS